MLNSQTHVFVCRRLERLFENTGHLEHRCVRRGDADAGGAGARREAPPCGAPQVKGLHAALARNPFNAMLDPGVYRAQLQIEEAALSKLQHKAQPGTPARAGAHYVREPAELVVIFVHRLSAVHFQGSASLSLSL